MKKPVILVITLLITLILPIVNAIPATYYSNNYNENINATSLYKNNVNSMVYIETQDSSGSGVIVKPDGTFITCFHVIANADYITVKLKDGSIYNVNGFRYINPLEDVAILTLDTTRQFKPINLNPLNSIEIGEKVYTISNPEGIQFVFSEGIINQYSKDNIQFSAPISSGSSGGALLNQNGYLIGIITSSLVKAQNINFALPNNYYKDKANNVAIKNTKNLNWTEFVVENANYEQFKLYSDYALNDLNFGMFYKYLQPFTKRNDIPKEYYPMIGHFALFAYLFEENEECLNDAIKYYELAYNNNQNDASVLAALLMLYGITDDKRYNLHKDIATRFYKSYPINFNTFLEICNKSLNCKTDKCYEEVGLELIIYIFDLIEKDNNNE